MAKLIMWNLASLDGFVAGPGGDISWLNALWGEELERISIGQCESAGALIFGRVTYELMAGYWPQAEGVIAGFMNALPKHVFSRTLKSSDWNNTFVHGADAVSIVTRLKRETPKDIFIFGSASFSETLALNGLIDEYRIGICPFLLGNGAPLFAASGRRTDLKLSEAKPLSNGVVVLRYATAH